MLPWCAVRMAQWLVPSLATRVGSSIAAVTVHRGIGTARSFSTPTAWNEEWRRVGLGAEHEGGDAVMNRLMFVQCGFGCDQHGDRAGAGATAAAVRACRNAIEFNSIPGMVDHVPGGRKNMLIKVKLGVPVGYAVDHDAIRATFPYGRLLPIEVVTGGLTYGSGRVVAELGDQDDTAIIVCAAVSIGYYDPNEPGATHKTFDTRDGY